MLHERNSAFNGASKYQSAQAEDLQRNQGCFGCIGSARFVAATARSFERYRFVNFENLNMKAATSRPQPILSYHLAIWHFSSISIITGWFLWPAPSPDHVTVGMISSATPWGECATIGICRFVLSLSTSVVGLRPASCIIKLANLKCIRELKPGTATLRRIVNAAVDFSLSCLCLCRAFRIRLWAYFIVGVNKNSRSTTSMLLVPVLAPTMCWWYF